jgi:hypothetical protein
MSAPNQVTIFTFNVGFGDCFLLRFSYSGGADRHVLIDFGSTKRPARAPNSYMIDIAKEIKKRCGGKLDLLVATHRHKDHISGFTTAANGKGSGDIISGLSPGAVLQPWTEHPDIPEDATDSMQGARAFAGALANMNGFAASLVQFAAGLDDRELKSLGLNKRDKAFLEFIGENNVSNRNAVENLIAMGKSGKAFYLHADAKPDLSAFLPGVKVHVLGPPTVKQHGEVATQNPKNEEEYWHLLAVDGAATTAAVEKGIPLFPKDVATEVAPHARWATHHLRAMRKDMLFSIVTALDDAMNNTSLILLFQVGGKSLLFPGDAQWENWQYALSKENYRKLLKGVDLYKVGHHGSLNATPKSLWNLFEQKSDDGDKKSRLVSVMSTMAGVHGHSEKTAVPRKTLVDALKAHSHFHTTEEGTEPIVIDL